MTRRTPLALSVLLALGLTSTAQAAGTLNLANWSDYFPPELLKKFEADTGIKATLDAYDSNETLLAKLKAGGGSYDVVVPSDSFIQIMIKEDLLQKFDKSKLPNRRTSPRPSRPSATTPSTTTPPRTCGAPPATATTRPRYPAASWKKAGGRSSSRRQSCRARS